MARIAVSCTWPQMDSAHVRRLGHEIVLQPEAETALLHAADLALKALKVLERVAAKARDHAPDLSPALFHEAVAAHHPLDVTTVEAARLAEVTHLDALVT